MALPTIKSYRTYSQSGYGTNSLKMDTSKFTMYFIKQTLAGYLIKDSDKAVLAHGYRRSTERVSLAAINQEFIDMGLGDKVERVRFHQMEGSFAKDVK